MPTLPLLLLLLPAVLLPCLRQAWWWRRVLPALACAFLLVLLALVASVHPALDDWVSASLLHHLGWWQGQRVVYATIGGRITATAVDMTAVLAGTTSYRCTVLLLLLLQALAILLVVRRSWPGRPWPEALGIAAVVLAGVAALLPSPAEGLFWLPGAACYLLGTLLGLLTIALLTGAPRRLPLAVAAAVIAALAGACSELAGVLLLVGLGIGGLEVARVGPQRRAVPWAVCMVGTCAGLTAIALSPANAHRLAAIGPSLLSPTQAVRAALLLPLRSAGGLLLQPLALGLLCLGVAWGCAHPRSWPRPAVLLVGGAAGLALAAFPALVLVGPLPPRAADALLAATVWVDLALAVALGMRLRRWRPPAPAGRMLAPIALLAACGSAALLLDGHEPALGRLGGGLGAITGLLIARRLYGLGEGRVRLDRRRLLGSGALLCAVGLVCTGNAPQALVDACWHAPLRAQALAAREAALAAAAPRLRARGGVVRVPPPDPRHFPVTISVGDLTCSPAAWVNRAYASAHDLPAIAVDPRVHALP